MLKKYRKIVEVEAVQWTGDNLEEIEAFGARAVPDGKELLIISLKVHPYRAFVGDYIIKGERGFYPVKDNVFNQSYEEVLEMPDPIEMKTTLNYILNMLWEISGGDEKQIRRFMHEPRIEWLGLTPISLLSCGKGTEVAKLLEGMIDGDPIS